MKALFIALALVPTIAAAQFEESVSDFGVPMVGGVQPYPPQYPIAVQPILPVPRDKGPWGTGYSVLTETRSRPDIWGQFLGDRNAKKSQTIQRVVPNDATGQPINGVDMPW